MQLPRGGNRRSEGVAELQGSADGFLRRGGGILAVQSGDEICGNSRRANGFTRIIVRTIAEAFLVHSANHLEDTAVLFRLALRKQPEMTGFGADEEHGRTVRTCGCACPAPDTGGSVHREISNGFRNREGVRIGSGAAALTDKPARLNDAIESASVNGQVAHDRKGRNPEWFDRDDVAIVKVSHVKLASGAPAWAMRDSVDGQAARATDALATIVVERNGLDVFLNKALVDDVEHLEKGSIRGNIKSGIDFEAAALLRAVLTPDL